MKQKIAALLTALLLTLVFAGCACNNAAAPTNSPSMAPVTTPHMEQPMNTPETGLSASPDLSTSPDAGSATGEGTIEGFAEGKEVQQADVPLVVKAVTDKYENATIQSIKFATMDKKQVYAVTLSGGTSNGQTVYVNPDGTLYEPSMTPAA